MKRYPLTLFFFLAFLFPWIIWGTTIAQSRGWLGFHLPQPLAFWIGLTAATYLAAALTGGQAALRDLLARLFRWRVGPQWYAAALLTTAALGLLALGIERLLGGAPQVGALLPTAALLPSLAFQVFFFWLTEETAWRGFALPRLQARFSALNASLILGLLWGLWHLPLVFIPDSFQATLPFGGFVLSAIATTILMTWVFNHSRGNVLLAALFHAATDVAIAYFGVMSGGPRLFWLFVLIQWVVAGTVVLLEGAQTLARRADRTEVTYPPGAASRQ